MTYVGFLSGIVAYLRDEFHAKNRILTNRLLVYSCGIKLPVIINTAEESSSESTNFTSARVIIKQSAIIFET